MQDSPKEKSCCGWPPECKFLLEGSDPAGSACLIKASSSSSHLGDEVWTLSSRPPADRSPFAPFGRLRSQPRSFSDLENISGLKMIFERKAMHAKWLLVNNIEMFTEFKKRIGCNMLLSGKQWTEKDEKNLSAKRFISILLILSDLLRKNQNESKRGGG